MEFEPTNSRIDDIKIMINIALPKKIEFTNGSESNRKIVVIEPCYPGYGTTLGNALRRVLLSSLPGAAVVGVKIKGASHEFMTIPHVKEDVLEIILSLKQLRLKIFTDEVIKLELVARGEKEVKAGDITKNSQVEIINADFILANITDMAGSLEMEIFVSKGAGYQTIESREEERHEIGYIAIDSIFSPVLSVGINVENIRVGKMTNWDKLNINILTDGTITPEDAFYKSVKILIDQFNALVEQPEEKTVVVTEEKNEEADEIPEALITEKSESAEDISVEKKAKKRGRPKKSL